MDLGGGTDLEPTRADLVGRLDALAGRTRFSGVVRIDEGDSCLIRTYGMADRAHEIPVVPETRFGIASGAKGFTALAVMSLVEDGTLELTTPARSLLGEDLPLIDDAVTVEQLLSHRSGIGDYLDEEQIESSSDYVLSVPTHRLVTTEDFLSILGGHRMVSPPGERFAYNNGGYVVLALLAERASGVSFHQLVEQRVCRAAGLGSTGFLRMDELPGDAAVGYLDGEGLRTNALHLPVRGSGDGGILTTVADMRTLWTALFDGRIVSERSVSMMTRPHGGDAERDYGLGFWLHRGSSVVELHGYDAGVSFRSTCDPASGASRTVVSNWSEGTWPLEEVLWPEGPE